MCIRDSGGSSFRNKLIAELCKLFKIKHTISSPHHPQTDWKFETCQKTKTSPHRRKAPLKPLEVVEPFGRLHLDFVGPLPVTPEKFKHILVIVDSSILWVEAFPTKTSSAEDRPIRCWDMANFWFFKMAAVLHFGFVVRVFGPPTKLSLIHIWRCRRIERCRSRWSPYH